MPIFAGCGSWGRNTNEAPILYNALPACSGLCRTRANRCGGRAGRSGGKNIERQTGCGGIVIEPSSGKIAEGDTITITFPVGMVSPDLIDVGDQRPPFLSAPKLEGSFLWKSETEGVFTVSGVVAGAHHRLTLAPGLKDATGNRSW